MQDLIVPRRCRGVFACLSGHTEKPLHVRMTGKWRNKDLQEITGSSAADVRMRELVRMNPGAFVSEKIEGSTGALHFALAVRPWAPASRPEPRLADVAGTGTPSLFDLEANGII